MLWKSNNKPDFLFYPEQPKERNKREVIYGLYSECENANIYIAFGDRWLGLEDIKSDIERQKEFKCFIISTQKTSKWKKNKF
ncbi:hypothetical protein Mgra_00005214 [Meloidogyne graminicola]|uniref:Uncharacterized protein n=1 Tax=Meloidogyne graminicola TaxID=189291 RepID=A0A8S9ZPL6_9BILA|nr:hypothetical protein Mgra_00005214 [Meloidogyne graminicola]